MSTPAVDPLKDAVAYGRRLRDDDHTAYGLSHNEQRILVLTKAVDDMARALQHAAALARMKKSVPPTACSLWVALAEAVK
jgi:hypothetical protein